MVRITRGRHQTPEDIMWDNAERTTTNLSHDMPCTQCGHATHSYLPCSDECDCVPTWLADVRKAEFHVRGLYDTAA
jgi:hypothetical protein